MFLTVALGWTFVGASFLLAGYAVLLDRKLQRELPPVLRTPAAPKGRTWWMDDLDDEIFATMDAMPVRWRRELYPAQYRAAIDAFWLVVFLAIASVAVGGTLVSVFGAAI